MIKYQKYYFKYLKKTLKRLTLQANVQRRRPNWGVSRLLVVVSLGLCYFSFGNCLVTVFVCALKKQLQIMLIKWKITLSRWLWQSIGGESRNFWSITIPALFQSSVEHLITLLGASSRTKASATVQRFFRAPMESIALYALFDSYSRIFDHNIRHRVSVSLW